MFPIKLLKALNTDGVRSILPLYLDSARAQHLFRIVDVFNGREMVGNVRWWRDEYPIRLRLAAIAVCQQEFECE